MHLPFFRTSAAAEHIMGLDLSIVVMRQVRAET
jgi:hypothetical protein